jgi:hypothetical protein
MEVLLMRLRSLLLIVSVLLFPWLAVQAKPTLQEPCPLEQACVDVSLPAGQVGDFLVDGVVVAGQVNATRLGVTPALPHVVSVQNIVNTDPASGFGDLFIYAPVAPQTVTLPAGQVRAVAFRTTQQWLKGIVNVTCDLKGFVAGQDASCVVGNDPAQLLIVPAGATAPISLPVGPNSLNVVLAGANADLWAPANQVLKVNAVGGRPASAKATFNRKGQVNLVLAVPGAVADFYLDDVLIASQVPTASSFVAAGNHKAEARNITDPTANGVFRWLDVAVSATASANQTRDVKLTPKKEFLQGMADVTCKVNGFEPGLDVSCGVSSNGLLLGLVPAGQKMSFPLGIGAQILTVDVVGAQADLWAPKVREFPITVNGGRSTPINASFDRKGLLTINIADPNVVGDIFVNGVQVATQVNSTQVSVEPNAPLTVEARNLANVQAPGAFLYAPLSATTRVPANKTQSLTLKLGQVTEMCTESMTYVHIYNGLNTQLVINLTGPETKTLRIATKAHGFYCLLPGTYQYSASAVGYTMNPPSTRDYVETGTGGCYLGQHANEGEPFLDLDCGAPELYRRP